MCSQPMVLCPGCRWHAWAVATMRVWEDSSELLFGLFVCFCLGQVFCSSGRPRVESQILVLPASQCWDCWCVPPCPHFRVVPEIWRDAFSSQRLAASDYLPFGLSGREQKVDEWKVAAALCVCDENFHFKLYTVLCNHHHYLVPASHGPKGKPSTH